MKSKQELKAEYKLKKYKMGVFQIRNTVNGKIYLDCSLDLEAIWNRNRMQLNVGNHSNTVLQNDWKEFGEANFKYEILSEIMPQEGVVVDYNREVKQLLGMYLDELKPFDEKGYNNNPK